MDMLVIFQGNINQLIHPGMFIHLSGRRTGCLGKSRLWKAEFPGMKIQQAGLGFD